MAQVHAKQLAGTSYETALLSVAPLECYKHREKCTFVMTEVMQDGAERDRVATGFVHSFGSCPIRYLPAAQPAVCPCSPAHHAGATSSSADDQPSHRSSGRSILHVSNLCSCGKCYAQNEMTCISQTSSAWKWDDQSMTWLQRVSEKQAPLWMLSKDLDISYSPVGDDTSTHRVLWDKETTTVAMVNSKYSKVPGYAGPVVTSKGCGARILAKHFDSARVMAGMPCGELWWVQGVPLEYDESDIPELLRAAGWNVQLVPHAKRVRGTVMHLKVRAEKAPPQSLLRVATKQEIITLHVVPHQVTTPKREDVPKAEPTTWAGMVKQTLGKEPAHVVSSDPEAAEPMTRAAKLI